MDVFAGGDFPEDNFTEEAARYYRYLLSLEEKNERSVDNSLNELAVALLALFSASTIPSIKKSSVRALLKREMRSVVEKLLKFGDPKRGKYYEALVAKYFNQAAEDIFSNVDAPTNQKKKEQVTKAVKGKKGYLHRILRTELWKSMNEKRLKQIKDKGYKYKTTHHILDAKTGRDSRYFSSLKQVKQVNKEFSYIWNGRKRSFMAPPDRPNDRGVVIPYGDPEQ